MRSKWAVPVIFSILILGGLGLSQQAFSAHFLVDNWVEAEWVGGPFPPAPLPASFIDSFSSLPFPLDATPPTMFTDPSGIITIDLPNFVDDLPLKFIEIDVIFTGPTFPTTAPATADGFDSFTGAPVTCIEEFSGPTGPSTWTIGISCLPNPDSETIVLTFDPSALSSITEILVETESIDDFFFVGGTEIPIDTTSLLLAGAQSVSMWMIPVVAAVVVIGVFVIKRRN